MSLRSAWPSSACVPVGLSQSAKISVAPIPAALSLVAALDFLLRVGVLCCVVVGGRPSNFTAALGLAAALGFAFFCVRGS
jgi:hypothetical protein